MAFKDELLNLIRSRIEYINTIEEILSKLAEEVREECGISMTAFDNSIGGWKVYLSDFEFIVTYDEVKKKGRVFGDDLKKRLEEILIDKVRVIDGMKPIYR